MALFIGSGLSLVYPQAARLGVDDVLMGASKYDWRLLGLGMMALFIIQAVFVSLRYYLFTVVGERVVADLRMTLFRRIWRKRWGFFDSTKTGELTSRLTSDTQVLQNAVTSNLSMALRYATQALGGVAVLFATSWQLALIMIVSVPPMVWFARYYGRKVRALSATVQNRLADSTAIAEESISGVRTVRSFAAETQSVARYTDAVEISFQAAKRRGFVGAVFGGAISLSGYGVVALIWCLAVVW
ncbi:MAG: ABC transporter transmembrane domain-containing protein [bacterium]